MQKLVTIYLTDSEENDQEPKEHLGDYLADGWSIVKITPMGGGAGASSSDFSLCYIAGWFAVLMEK